MQLMIRWIGYLAVSVLAVSVIQVSAEPKEASSLDRVERNRTEKQPVSDVIFNRSPSDVMKYFPIPADIKHFHVGGGGQAVSVAGVEEKLIYSALLGSVVAQVPPQQLVADDIVYTAQPGSCGLRRYLFQVIGKANPEQEGGEYTVTYGLYDNCPGAGGKLIPGTGGGCYGSC